jgi:hypothetical protein
MDSSICADELAHGRLARKLYSERRLRNRFFPKIGAEPGWDILLYLYDMRNAERPTSVSSACLGGCAPTATAMRWLGRLGDADLLRFWPDGTDRRVTYVGLSEVGLERLTGFLDVMNRGVWRENGTLIVPDARL